MTDVDLYRPGAITSIGDLVRLLRPDKSEALPTKLPPPAIITDDEKAALARLPQVFGSVVPTEKRDLHPDEVAKLYEERVTLDTLEKLIKDRKEAIRTTVANALDVQSEPVRDPEVPRDKDGHLLRPGGGKVPIPGTHKCFSWEVSGGRASLDTEALREISDNDEISEVTHQDYLDMTTPVRVLDEAKFFQKIKEKPELLRHAKSFVKHDAPRASLYIRKHG